MVYSHSQPSGHSATGAVSVIPVWAGASTVQTFTWSAVGKLVCGDQKSPLSVSFLQGVTLLQDARPCSSFYLPVLWYLPSQRVYPMLPIGIPSLFKLILLQKMFTFCCSRMFTDACAVVAGFRGRQCGVMGHHHGSSALRPQRLSASPAGATRYIKDKKKPPFSVRTSDLEGGGGKQLQS